MGPEQGAEPFEAEISRRVWSAKYRYQDEIQERSVEQSWRRIAHALAAVEPRDQELWALRFQEALAGFRFLPGGRIQAGAGTELRVTLFNCFVMGLIEDSMEGIFEALKEGAETMQQGGGVGYDFSSLRPRGTRARTTGTIASGPVSFMDIWDAMCGTILSTGARRGAMMATLRCDHPDIEELISAKRVWGRLRNFNLSVQVSDKLMEAVRKDAMWPLVFPADRLKADGPGLPSVTVDRWPGEPGPVRCFVLRELRARELWERIMRSTYEYAEPGVLFIDRVNRLNNLWYRERITATNPCGEIPLPPYGACDLGSINLTCFVREPFTERASIDMEGIRRAAEVATRMLDDVIDASRFPLDAQEQQARGSRRLGLGLTGLADALTMLGLHYAGEKARRWAGEVMRAICHAAYRTSIALAKEKGAFPFFDRDKYLRGPFVRSLPDEIQRGIAEQGIRNSHLTAVAPTGTISLLANNVSSGIEPIFDLVYRRRVTERDGSRSEHQIEDFAFRRWKHLRPGQPVPDTFIAARDVSPEAQIAMQAALQPYVDNAISKTIFVPEAYDFGAFQKVYELAYERGLKGCTTYRPNPITGQVLGPAEADQVATHCCSIEREAD